MMVFMVGLLIHTTDIQDRDGVVSLLTLIRRSFSWQRHVFADGGHTRPRPKAITVWLGRWTLQIVKRSDSATGSIILTRQWAEAARIPPVEPVECY